MPVPDHGQMEPAWRKLRLTVNVITKLNRSALLPGEISYILPIISRLEIDETQAGQQVLSMEDTSGCVHGNRGLRKPDSPHLISEIRLLCELAKKVLAPNPRVRWDEYMTDYAEIRREISETLPDTFWDYERRMWDRAASSVTCPRTGANGTRPQSVPISSRRKGWPRTWTCPMQGMIRCA
jgi:hypothetical protein